MRTAAELTLGKEPNAVPKARRFVASCLAGAPTNLVDDVELVVTELVTNSLLHGQPPVAVRLVDQGESIRVEVEDAGLSLPFVATLSREAMTGRGLTLVASLATGWGVDVGRNGSKVVWAELPASLPATSAAAPPDITPEALVASQMDRHAGPTYVVRLLGVPTGLLLAAKAHIDNVVRELALLRGGQASGASPMPPAMAALVQTITGEIAEARAEIKRQAVAAAARGDALTDIELRLPLSFADVGERYLAALEEADRYARAARLLTMAPPPSHRTFRRWYVGALIDQVRAQAARRAPAPPQPLAEVLAAQIDDLEPILRPIAPG
jgi:anti-sigma regulatory factor (Ser/Thr protein kinase)